MTPEAARKWRKTIDDQRENGEEVDTFEIEFYEEVLFEIIKGNPQARELAEIAIDRDGFVDFYDGRCEHGMFRSGAGSCPSCGQ